MSDEKPFCIERAKQGRAACKKCKDKCPKAELRIGKIAPSIYGEGTMKVWHHVDCIFEQFLKQRATTKRIQSCDDLDGFDELEDVDQQLIEGKIIESEKVIGEKYGIKVDLKGIKKNKDIAKVKEVKEEEAKSDKVYSKKSFKDFRRLVANITNVSSYTDKTAQVAKVFSNNFDGDIHLWCKLLLPGIFKRIYNLQSKQLIKLFSRIFVEDEDDMLRDLEKGDIGETIQKFFEQSVACKPTKKSNLTVEDVEEFLEALSKLTKEDDQVHHFKKLLPKCTGNDLKVIIRLIKHDLRMNAGAKHVLEGVHSDAYEAYQSSKDLKLVMDRCFGGKMAVSITIMTPVLPMLAKMCGSIKDALKRCPNGMYSEIKYDGERVQVHKHGNEFKYFSRSLKPVQEYKIAHLKDYIPKAFKHGNDLILDSEILMVDTISGQPLPFGTLGKHKKTGLQDASVCLFVFDCLYFNGEDLTKKPLKDRKKILQENMTEIENHLVFSEHQEINEPKKLAEMITKTLEEGLEGLVLKDKMGVYNPGKRHWLKVKKDYLLGGTIADSADLIVLGAWFGTGKKGGMMSVFLMGVYNPDTQKFCTVTKVHTGHDDKTLLRLQDELEMIKISKDMSKVPKWLNCSKPMVPDFVAKDPKNQPVWEITGAEFTQQLQTHTADGISIRFPRVTRIRDDKTWETATNIKELNALFKNSKNFNSSALDAELKELTAFDSDDIPQTSVNTTLKKRKSDDSDDELSPAKKRKTRKVDLKKPLPELFDDILLKLAGNFEEKYSETLRVFCAYGGSIVKEEDSFVATHILHDVDSVDEEFENCPSTAFHVTILWIVKSISELKLLDPFDFAVSLNMKES